MPLQETMNWVTATTNIPADGGPMTVSYVRLDGSVDTVFLAGHFTAEGFEPYSEVKYIGKSYFDKKISFS